LLAATPSGTWRAAPPQPCHGQPNRCGRRLCAALSRACPQEPTWGRTLVEAVAVSAAAVAAPLAGEFDAAVRKRLLAATRLWSYG